LRASTIDALARELESRREPHPWTPLVEIQPGGTKPPLFCIHPLGGEVLCYLELAQALGPDQPVYGLQARAWGDGEGEGPATIGEMAATYVAAIRQTQPHGPYRLAGWSLGGMLALEMAQQLQAAGEEISLLAPLDTLMVPRAEAPDADIPRALASLAGNHPAVSVDHLRSLTSFDEQLACFVELVNRERIVPGLELQTVRRYARASRVNAEAKRVYVPRPYRGRIILFRAREGHVVSCPDPTLGWGALAGGGLDIHEVSGRHDTLAYRPHVHELAQILKNYLDANCLEEPCSTASFPVFGTPREP
jgi:thioesterase domain-containing protein